MKDWILAPVFWRFWREFLNTASKPRWRVKAEQSVRTRLLFFPTSICNPFFDEDFILINLVTVFHAILTSRQTGEKLQWLFENPKRLFYVLKKIWLVYTKASLPRILLKKLRALHALEDLVPLFKIFYNLCLSVRKSRENCRQIYGKSKESLWRNLSTGMPPNFLGQSFAL